MKKDKINLLLKRLASELIKQKFTLIEISVSRKKGIITNINIKRIKRFKKGVKAE